MRLPVPLHLRDLVHRLQPRAQRVAATDLRPARQQRRADTGSGRAVRILTGGHVDPLGARFPDEGDDGIALPPHIDAERFDMRDVDRDLCFASDADRLVHGADEAYCIGTLVS